mmetsp:Transcript_33356/g.116925  ORF Transcript_33356/g.116925 Transcript_33356/m.116925 type:complete len:287 (-) Transcript_33356:1058-1918(-)
MVRSKASPTPTAPGSKCKSTPSSRPFPWRSRRLRQSCHLRHPRRPTTPPFRSPRASPPSRPAAARCPSPSARGRCTRTLRRPRRNRPLGAPPQQRTTQRTTRWRSCPGRPRGRPTRTRRWLRRPRGRRRHSCTGRRSRIRRTSSSRCRRSCSLSRARSSSRRTPPCWRWLFRWKNFTRKWTETRTADALPKTTPFIWRGASSRCSATTETCASKRRAARGGRLGWRRRWVNCGRRMPRCSTKSSCSSKSRPLHSQMPSTPPQSCKRRWRGGKRRRLKLWKRGRQVQ